MKVSHRIPRLVAVGLAAGALASPVASARPAPVDSGVLPSAREVARNAQSQAREVARSAETAVSQRDAAHSSYQPQPAQDLRSPDTQDAALISQGLMEPPTTNVVRVDGLASVPAPADGFDWLDAALGAAGALGLALLVAGGTLAVRHRAHHDDAVAA